MAQASWYHPPGSSLGIGFIGGTPIQKFGVEARAIALISPLPFLICGVFTLVIARIGFRSVESGIKLAVAVRLIGPLPLILTNAALMKLHRVFVASYAFGWLVKLLVVAGWFLR